MPLLSCARLGAPTSFDPQRKFVTSPFVSPAVLAAAASSSRSTRSAFLSYFTQLSYIGLTAYLWASGVQTFCFARYGPAAFIVTVVFWALLATPTTLNTSYKKWSNISIHAMNSAFALFELCLTNAPPAPWAALPVGIILLGGYLGVAYITHVTQGFYTYAFLDPTVEHARLAAYIIGIAAGDALVFLLARLLVILRIRLVRRYGGEPEGIEAGDTGTSPEALDEWEEVAAPVRVGKDGEGTP
ncbi:hypothetical protein B0H10DRAFT_1993721 [Mycena sp. CBHHK59/15]|nr:hypothetical protein B0H10DRAFT_1993721 [Mycena sp. CBHHK59/15]